MIEAEPAQVYEYFTRPDAFVTWMGESARLDPSPGGTFSVDIDGSPVRGTYEEVDPPHRVVFTWGVEGSDLLPPGSTTVEVTLTAEAGGTRVEVVHGGLPPDERALHERGWRHFLGVLVSRARRPRP
jgi:uncharacterized protein YndB with AHSA1/START domain